MKRLIVLKEVCVALCRRCQSAGGLRMTEARLRTSHRHLMAGMANDCGDRIECDCVNLYPSVCLADPLQHLQRNHLHAPASRRPPRRSLRHRSDRWTRITDSWPSPLRRWLSLGELR